ncbi:hypothetical protein HB662_02120 [Roseomonas frigidaquae]|uniref:Uncharacterized protein n=1 Tax=Falsiroseomonas frigidaquae TaxID=487318 RepID=A0ABX1ESG4_9PROT|nr:hypothetical protein [Falsiroseomonas frigidaquae]NKE43555.1 hypothetical protein [Falsiroseomonas frigidaquae]
MTDVLLHGESLRALKTAFRRLVADVGGLAAAEACVRVSDSQLSRYYDQADLATFPPADVIAQLEAIAGEPVVTAELARLRGYRLARLGQVDSSMLTAAVAEFARHAGGVPATLCESLADGKLSRAEADSIGRLAAHQARQLEAIAAKAAAMFTSSLAAPAVESEGAPAARGPHAGRAGRRQPRARRT